mgnify:CR=1 FL=1
MAAVRRLCGEGDRYFLSRYHQRVTYHDDAAHAAAAAGALGLGPFTFQGGQQFQLDPSNRTRPDPMLGGRVNDRHCSGENATKFDWQLFVTGTSIGLPENAAERRRLFSVCGIALCEREAGVPMRIIRE